MPVVSFGIYPSIAQAEQVVTIVGIRNAEAAYFGGRRQQDRWALSRRMRGRVGPHHPGGTGRWAGLPTGCRPSELIRELSDDTSAWAGRSLGEEFERAALALVDLSGYYRPIVSVRDGAVVMFDGMNPHLAGGLEPLLADLGEPEERLTATARCR